jgi:hypothetical protein
VTLTYVILTAHFVGDFVFQSDWMAVNKSKSYSILAMHVITYTLTLLISLIPIELPGTLAWVAINGVVHYIQDAITSRINAKLWAAGQRHWFFVGIGADQLLHYITLFVTASWILS